MSGDDSEESSAAVTEEARLLFESGVVKLCDVHGVDLVPVDCVSCRMVSRTVRAPVLTEFIELTKGKSVVTAQIPGAASRFASRIDEKTPTLTFTEQDMALASSLFSRGKMAPATLFDELTREYLFLPQGQNESLTKSVQLEQFLLKYKKDKTFSNVFHYVEQMAKLAKHLRISERPIILAMGELDRFMNAVKQHGKHLGFLYPSQGPCVQLLGPRKFNDQLSYTQLPVLPLPLPSLDDLLKDTSVSLPDKDQIAANLLAAELTLKEHMRDLSNKLGLFMDSVSSSVNRIDSFLGFHMDLFGHCDGEVTDLMRDKAATLFSPSFRSAVRGGAKAAGDKAGLLGGESEVRSRLSDATKEDELLAKTLHKPYKSKKGNSRGGGYNRYKGEFFPCFSLLLFSTFLVQGKDIPDPGLAGPDLGPDQGLPDVTRLLGQDLPSILVGVEAAKVPTRSLPRTRASRTTNLKRRILPSRNLKSQVRIFHLLVLLMKLGVHHFSCPLLYC